MTIVYFGLKEKNCFSTFQGLPTIDIERGVTILEDNTTC